MKRFLFVIIFMGLITSVYGLSIKDLQVNETEEEIKLKKSKFLSIEEKDLVQYEKIIRKLEKDKLTNIKANEEIQKIKTGFENYLNRRLNMTRKIFLVFRKEFDRVITHIEKVPNNRLPAFKKLLQIIKNFMDSSKFKGSKEKFQILQVRVNKLLDTIDHSLVKDYQNQLVLTAEDIAYSVFEAKIALLHRLLIEGNFEESNLWAKKIDKKYKNDPYFLALQSHIAMETYNRTPSPISFDKILEQELKKQVGNGGYTVIVKPKSKLDEAFFYYTEALKRGYPQDMEIPGLLSAIWERIFKRYKKIYNYWMHPTSVGNYRGYMKELVNHCKAIIQDVPFKKYANRAYKILDQIYRNWPSGAGANLIEYNEIMKFHRMTIDKKF